MRDNIKYGLSLLVIGSLGAWLFWTWHQSTSTAPWYGISSGLAVMSGIGAGMGLLAMFGLGQDGDS